MALSDTFRIAEQGLLLRIVPTQDPAEVLATLRELAGEIVARLAPVTRPGSTVLPHLQVSLGWSPEPVAPERLDWDILPDVLYLLDPLPLLGGG